MEWEPSDIIAAVSTVLLLATIVISLIIGIKSIRTTNKIEEKKYRMELLNGMSSWGIDVLAAFQNVRFNKEALIRYKQEAFNPGTNRDIMARYALVRNKAEYFNNSEIADLINKIAAFVAFNSNCITALCEGKTIIKELGAADLDIMKNKLGIKDQGESTPIETISGDAIMMVQKETGIYLAKVNDLFKTELT